MIAELHALAALSVFFFSDLSLGWHSQAYMTDASNYGYAVMSTAAAPDTLRSEAKWARQQGWGVQVDTAYSEQEWQEFSKDDLFQEDADAATGFRVTGRPGMAELFAGTGALAECFRVGVPTWAEAWEIDNGPQYDLLHQPTIARLMLRIRQGEFWWIHAGPPCSTFSRARIPKLRTPCHLWGSRVSGGRTAGK